MKLFLKNHKVSEGKNALLLCDEKGEIFPGQTGLEINQDQAGTLEVVATFLFRCIGDEIDFYKEVPECLKDINSN